MIGHGSRCTSIFLLAVRRVLTGVTILRLWSCVLCDARAALFAGTPRASLRSTGLRSRFASSAVAVSAASLPTSAPTSTPTALPSSLPTSLPTKLPKPRPTAHPTVSFQSKTGITIQYWGAPLKILKGSRSRSGDRARAVQGKRKQINERRTMKNETKQSKRFTQNKKQKNENKS